MALYFSHPWEYQEREPNATVETEIILEIEEKGKILCLKRCKDLFWIVIVTSASQMGPNAAEKKQPKP